MQPIDNHKQPRINYRYIYEANRANGTTGLHLIFMLLSNNIFFLGHMGVLSDHQLILYLLLFSLLILYLENYRVFSIGVMSLSIYRRYVLILIYRRDVLNQFSPCIYLPNQHFSKVCASTTNFIWNKVIWKLEEKKVVSNQQVIANSLQKMVHSQKVILSSI